MQNLHLITFVNAAVVIAFGAVGSDLQAKTQDAVSTSVAKEISSGCVANPIPTVPSGPATSADITQVTGERFRLTLWRQPCGGTDGQLILTFAPLAGSPQICAGDMEITQGGVSVGEFLLSTDPSGVSSDAVCGPVSVATSALIRTTASAAAFNDDDSFEFTFGRGGSNSDVKLTVPAYDPSSYPADGQVRRPSGNLSGSYCDPARIGEGVFIEVGFINERRVLFVSWYTYYQGTQRWIVGHVDFPAEATSVAVPMLVTSGANFGSNFNPADVTVIPWGTATFRFLSCSELSFDWASNEGERGTYSYVRSLGGLLDVPCK